jgi:serine/threonine protein kinase
MKTSPFKNSNFKDEYYERFNKQKSEFWDIFKSHYIPSPSFKDLVEKMLNPNPKERPTITEVLNHPWLSEPCLSRIEYQKDLTSKFKKIMGKVRKEQ